MGSFVSDNAVLIAVICGIIAVVYGVLLIRWLLALPAGDDKMREVAGAVQEGAKAYLGRQYRTIAMVGVVVFVIIGVALGAQAGLGPGLGDGRRASSSAPACRPPPASSA